MTTGQLGKQKVILRREIQTYIHKWTQSRSTMESLGVHLGHILAKIRLKLNNSKPISLSVLLVHRGIGKGGKEDMSPSEIATQKIFFV